MGYRLAEQNGESVAVPRLVFAHLARADGDTIRAALYLLGGGGTDPRTMARDLGMPSIEAAKRAMQYWAGAGLLVSDRDAPLPKTEMQKASAIDLTTLNDPYVSVLCEEAQTAFGKALSRTEMHLKQQAQRESWCIESAALFGIAPAQLSRWERGAIARWHEDWRFGADMIEEALLRADNHRTVRYVDGILRSWYAQGLTTVSAVRGQGQLAGSNILTTGAKPAAPKTDLFQTNWNDVFDDDTEG